MIFDFIILAVILFAITLFVFYLIQYNSDNQFITLVNNLDRHPPEPLRVQKIDEMSIVMVAGGPVYGKLAINNCRTLRSLGCVLPIYIFTLHNEYIDAEIDEYANVFELPPGLTGWSAKVEALIECPSRHVILLDADNVPLVDPTYLFHTEEYTKNGCILWPDVQALDDTSSGYRLFGLKTGFDNTGKLRFSSIASVIASCHLIADACEAGQIVMDTETHADGLAYIRELNINRHIVYNTLHGDKDTYSLGLQLADNEYHMTQFQPGIGGTLDSSGVFHGFSLLQRDVVEGYPIFAHYCGPHKNAQEKITHYQLPHKGEWATFITDVFSRASSYENVQVLKFPDVVAIHHNSDNNRYGETHADNGT